MPMPRLARGNHAARGRLRRPWRLAFDAGRERPFGRRDQERGAFDISAVLPTMRDLCETPPPAQALRAAEGPRLGVLSDILVHTPRDSGGSNTTRFLAPIDLQAIKAAGVTFAESLLERVIEERARGSREGAAKAREEIVSVLGDDLSTLKPGSPAAMRLKDALVKAGAWSQYLEVGTS